jgi:phage terminase large subunit-like protein
VRAFFRRFLRHSKGRWAGEPFELLAWQWQDVMAPLFGWRRPDGSRRFRKAFVEIPKKNGKSTLAAGLGLYMLVGDGEPGAHIFSTAVKREQAGIVHGEAVSWWRSRRALRISHHQPRHARNRFPRQDGFYRCLAADAGGSEGLNAHCVIIDELHAWTGEHGREFFNSLRYAARARRHGLLFMITTAGDDELSVCYDEYTYAKGVLSGEIIDTDTSRTSPRRYRRRLDGPGGVAAG